MFYFETSISHGQIGNFAIGVYMVRILDMCGRSDPLWRRHTEKKPLLYSKACWVNCRTLWECLAKIFSLGQCLLRGRCSLTATSYRGRSIASFPTPPRANDSEWVLGCGINIRSGYVYFTKDGEFVAGACNHTYRPLLTNDIRGICERATTSICCVHGCGR